jgi:DNA modification methylase
MPVRRRAAGAGRLGPVQVPDCPFLVVQAEALSAVSALRDRCVEAVVTDPPWNRGKPYGACDDDRPADTYQTWLATVLAQCARVSRGPMAVFLGAENGRQLETLLEMSGLQCLSLLHWQRSRGVHETVVVLGPTGTARLRETALRTASAVLSTAGEPEECFGHPCPKPVRAVESLVALVAPRGGTILDPFMGVGSTLLAAHARGCPAIGMEREDRFCRAAHRRMTEFRGRGGGAVPPTR